MRVRCGFIFLFLAATGIGSECLLNEFLIDAEDENTGEFIEILNCGTAKLDLRGWYICDAQDTDVVLPFPDSLLLPGQYGIILDPNYAGEYEHLIPDSVPRFTIGDARFGMYGISNSTAKPFALLDPAKNVRDSYLTGTPAWAPPGHSMERFSPAGGLWQPSLQPGGTPGFRNSTAMRSYELQLYSLEAMPHRDYIRIRAGIQNRGIETLSALSGTFWVLPDPAHPETEVSLSFDTLLVLNSGDSCSIIQDLSLPAKGLLPVRAYVSAENTTTDTLQCDCFVPLDENEIIITEFVCKTGENFHSEYVEYFSRSALPLQCRGLLFADQNGAVAIDGDYLLMPDSFLVLVQSESFYDDFPDCINTFRPSAWRSLNNNEDVISLLNPSGTVICSLHYDNGWHIPNDCAMLLADTALDYRDPAFWEFCYTGSPGEMNRAQKQGFHLACPEAGSFFTVTDTFGFRLINDGYFPLPAQVITLETPRIRHFYDLPESHPGDTLYLRPDTSDLFLPGTQDCRLFASDSIILNAVFRYFYPYRESPLFFNEVFFDPLDSYGQAEFVEMECRLPVLDLKNWTLHINNRSCVLDGSFSSGFLLLGSTGDPPPCPSLQHRLLLANFPALPNTGALCMLYDPAGRCMDRVDLREHPRISSGKSLEKQYEGLSSSDAGIWHASVAETGMTAGARNSITALPAGRDQLLIDPRVFSPGTDDRICFHIDSESRLDYCELFCFNMAGQCVFRQEAGIFSQPSLMLFWDGRLSDSSFPARGIYLVLAVLYDTAGGTRKLRNTLIVR
ncbi:MAG: hypothetical protein RBT66_06030 [bacterium]|jgi:hypothetical protein|nr:hypothetical protein [bacterium]